ncbi:adenomatous polyposis coli protein-like isoform X7 [Tenebrio molitor]|uniref:adenomatous polyposis coli protein-like isoform X7 n=1 Tax=Tenebrio molitor TaxID=7067 RepID=UPI0036247689
MMGITNAFSSLGINEREGPKENSRGNTIPKQYSTMSLPNLSSQRPQVYHRFMRPKYSRIICDDEIESSEQPVDFSKKYCETKLLANESKTLKNSSGSGTFNKVVKSYNSTFTMYAETDLDQPTDYSLRYAEDDSDSEQCNKISKSETTEFVQDTIKTYCTEDTPYETPFNFSTSTSMSDLRIDEKGGAGGKLETESKPVFSKSIETAHQSKIKSEFSSGLMSPEKPVNYCDEGTPGYFSRVDSCGSLNSMPASDPPKQELKEQNLEEGEKNKGPRRMGKFPSETTKAVKFEEVVNYAEETPLMFSRSSSLASLDSIEQHSIHDDRSSVVSDFSRLTSGLISPSELPDSPSQTVPPSPRPAKSPVVFPPSKRKTRELPQIAQDAPKLSVFEDVVTKFKVESTPLHLSAATSLSSLIDPDEIDSKGHHNCRPLGEGVSQIKNETNNLDINHDLSESSEDEDILAACINIGMQNNRYSQPPPNEAPSTSYQFKHPEIGDLANARPALKKPPQQLSIPIEVDQGGPLQKSDITCDSLRTYCTEDTPAVLSHAGSQSDLSVLSINPEENKIESKAVAVTDLSMLQQSSVGKESEEGPSDVKESDDLNISLELGEAESNHLRRSPFSSLSDDSDESEQALLQECILAGMPKSNSSPVPAIPDPSEIPNDPNLLQNEIIESEPSDDEDDANILENCINIGMTSNRYSQSKPGTEYQFQKMSVAPKISDLANDCVRSYYTEDTPALLSHAGSHSDLSVLSVNGENGTVKDYFSDINSNFSDDDEEEDEKLLDECVRFGMAKIAEAAKVDKNVQTSSYQTEGASGSQHQDKAEANYSESPDDSESISSLSDDSYESEQALLQQCIQAGMPARPRPVQNESADLTPAEKALLQQCILEGMKKCRISPKKPPEDDTSELTEADQALLRQCILSGMPKNRNLTLGGPSGSRDSAELTESERSLLQQCIAAGMPKSRNGRKPQWMRRPKEERAEHTCCIHCPRNNQNRAMSRPKTKKRNKDKVQVRESREILYVTGQIFALRKDVVEKSRQEWI